MMGDAQALKHQGCNDVAAPKLAPEKALIFRITHIRNVRWILEHGLHCQSSECRDPNFVQIGNPDLIDKRQSRRVLCSHGGVLSDYIPFYFTPHSPMLLNIKTGWNGLRMHPMRDIAILTTSLHRLHTDGLKYAFTDRHAVVQGVDFLTDLDCLDRIDWPLLRSRNFSRDPNDPEKMVRYAAEALVHRHLPVSSLLESPATATTRKRISRRRLSVLELASSSRLSRGGTSDD
jgi:hypothetical protein